MTIHTSHTFCNGSHYMLAESLLGGNFSFPVADMQGKIHIYGESALSSECMKSHEIKWNWAELGGIRGFEDFGKY